MLFSCAQGSRSPAYQALSVASNSLNGNAHSAVWPAALMLLIFPSMLGVASSSMWRQRTLGAAEGLAGLSGLTHPALNDQLLLHSAEAVRGLLRSRELWLQ